MTTLDDLRRARALLEWAAAARPGSAVGMSALTRGCACHPLVGHADSINAISGLATEEPDECGARGPAAPEVDEDNPGSGLPPLVWNAPKWLERKRQQRPAAGYAQRLLNEFLSDAVQFGAQRLCPTNPIEFAAALSQVNAPLKVDCFFGKQTEAATKTFQICKGLTADGKVGSSTWRLLLDFHSAFSAREEAVDVAWMLVDGDDPDFPPDTVAAALTVGAPAQPPKPKPKPRLVKPPAQKKGTRVESIDVDLAKQRMTIHYSDRKPETVTISSGRGRPHTKGDPCADQNSTNCTPTGEFPVRGIATAAAAHKNARGQPMPYYVDLITSRGIGIHGSGQVPGVPASHGCIRVDPVVARRIWQGVVSSTRVRVSGKAPTKAWPPKKPRSSR
jgi:lipoprotein-anchoring transpeptidase ErfK/SrfK